MVMKSILLGAAFVLATSVGSVQAEVPFTPLAEVPAVNQAAVPFSTLAEVPAVKMSSDEMDAVRGKDHVIRLVQFRSGLLLTQPEAINATTAAGSRSGAMGVGKAQDRASIVGMLP